MNCRISISITRTSHNESVFCDPRDADLGWALPRRPRQPKADDDNNDDDSDGGDSDNNPADNNDVMPPTPRDSASGAAHATAAFAWSDPSYPTSTDVAIDPACTVPCRRGRGTRPPGPGPKSRIGERPLTLP